VLVVEEFLRRTARDDVAGFEQHDPRGKEQRFAKIVRDKHDGFSQALDKPSEFALQLGACDRIESAKWLIHEKEGWIGGEGPGNTNPLALATGKLTGTPMGKFARVQAHEAEHLLHTGGSAGSIPLFQIGNEPDVLCNRKMREKTRVLDDVTDPTPQPNQVPIAGRALLNAHLPFRRK